MNWKALENKWQKKWARSKLHETDPAPARPKYFVTAAYPYPNSPQHIGHGRTYMIADVNARFHRMKGFNTLYPMGFHYTGTPVFAMSRRLSENDAEIIRTFTRIYNIPESRLEQLKDPVKMAGYFRDEIRKGMVEMGYSIDWRREFTTIDPMYKRFIQWHFRKLREKGLITRGTHPVGWCPRDNGPVGQHDTQGDIEPEIGEFHLVKFEKDGVFYPTATLRPETIFGVTNLWVNPNARYVQVMVDGETWVVSRAAAEKLRHQNHTLEITREIDPTELLWSTVNNPITRTSIPILSGDFVDERNGSGVVMSVPGHAPYDYQALLDLKLQPPESGDLAKKLAAIQPLSIIKLEGYSELPAADITGKFQIKDQRDPRLEDATKEVYSREFRQGIMKQNAGAYAGMPVSKAREAIVQDFTKIGLMTSIFEMLNRPVICRCGAECLVHIVENQWFIDYGDPSWKKLAHRCLDQMTLLPEDSRTEFDHVLDWLKEKACARKVGLGTKLPWDKEWVIESLSDSVVYMAYYILAKFLSRYGTVFRKFDKDPDKLPDTFFDHVFLGHGNAKEIGKATRIPPRLIDAIRKEFMYFYPVDMRHSAKDLVPNHLSFYIFHHVMLFPSELWPKGIVANGFVLMDGVKMSKSLENIIPLRQGIRKYGADSVRIGVLATAELGQDTDFNENLVAAIQERLTNLIVQARKLRRASRSIMKTPSELDHWMLSRLNKAIIDATEAMEKLRVREAINTVLYQLDNDLGWYQRRTGPRKPRQRSRATVLRMVLEARARMLAPIAPHTAEEVWNSLGNKNMVNTSRWPSPNPRVQDSRAEQNELLIRQTLEDTWEILRTTGMSPKRVIYYSAALWKWQIFLKALETMENNQQGQRNFVKDVMSHLEYRKLGKEAAEYASKAILQARQISPEVRKLRIHAGRIDGGQVLTGSRNFLERELKSKVEAWTEGDETAYDPRGKARLAEPYRPAILIE